MADPRTERNALLGATLVKKLQARAFDAYYCATKEEALQQALALIPETDVISWGGSATIAEIGLLDYVRKNFKCIDRDTAKTPEERMEIMRKALLCDTFLMSTNAMTTEGELVISGTTGYIYVPAPWWKTEYFEIRREDPTQNKRYFYQLDGEGIRYELVSFLKAIQDGKNYSYIDDRVSKAFVEVIEDYYNKKDLVKI